MAMKAFRGNARLTLGVEQEYHLADGETGELVSAYDAVRGGLAEELRGRTCQELYQCVLETQSPACGDVDELLASMIEDRQALARGCAEHGVRLVAAGSHPFSDWRRQRLADSDHYRWVVGQCGYLARRLLAFGLHVHVGMPGADEAFYVINRMRRWTYPLLGLSANSPFFGGERTGLLSTRHHLFGAMPRTHLPPWFEHMDELEAHFEAMKVSGDVTAPGDLWWTMRPQPVFGTVEFRIMDLPSDVRRTAALAAVLQGVCGHYLEMYRQGEEAERCDRVALEQNRWQAVRYGVDGKLLDPVTGELVEMRAALAEMLTLAESQAERLGTGKHIAFARTMLEEGNEAQWQLAQAEKSGGDLRGLELALAERTMRLD